MSNANLDKLTQLYDPKKFFIIDLCPCIDGFNVYTTLCKIENGNPPNSLENRDNFVLMIECQDMTERNDFYSVNYVEGLMPTFYIPVNQYRKAFEGQDPIYKRYTSSNNSLNFEFRQKFNHNTWDNPINGDFKLITMLFMLKFGMKYQIRFKHYPYITDSTILIDDDNNILFADLFTNFHQKGRDISEINGLSKAFICAELSNQSEKLFIYQIGVLAFLMLKNFSENLPNEAISNQSITMKDQSAGLITSLIFLMLTKPCPICINSIIALLETHSFLFPATRLWKVQEKKGYHRKLKEISENVASKIEGYMENANNVTKTHISLILGFIYHFNLMLKMERDTTQISKKCFFYYIEAQKRHIESDQYNSNADNAIALLILQNIIQEKDCPRYMELLTNSAEFNTISMNIFGYIQLKNNQIACAKNYFLRATASSEEFPDPCAFLNLALINEREGEKKLAKEMNNYAIKYGNANGLYYDAINQSKVIYPFFKISSYYNPCALNCCGYLLLAGTEDTGNEGGINELYSSPIKVFMKAESNKNFSAGNNIAWMEEYGHSIKMNKTAAMNHFVKILLTSEYDTPGYVAALVNYGFMIEYSQICKAKKSESMFFYTLGIDDRFNNPKAKDNYAYALHTGSIDYFQAISILKEPSYIHNQQDLIWSNEKGSIISSMLNAPGHFVVVVLSRIIKSNYQYFSIRKERREQLVGLLKRLGSYVKKQKKAIQIKDFNMILDYIKDKKTAQNFYLYYNKNVNQTADKRRIIWFRYVILNIFPENGIIQPIIKYLNSLNIQPNGIKNLVKFQANIEVLYIQWKYFNVIYKIIKMDKSNAQRIEIMKNNDFHKIAIIKFKEAADNNDENAMYHYGRFLRKEDGNEYLNRIEYIEKAAKKKHSRACALLMKLEPNRLGLPTTSMSTKFYEQKRRKEAS